MQSLLGKQSTRVLLIEMYPQREAKTENSTAITEHKSAFSEMLEELQAFGFNDITHVG